MHFFQAILEMFIPVFKPTSLFLPALRYLPTCAPKLLIIRPLGCRINNLKWLCRRILYYSLILLFATLLCPGIFNIAFAAKAKHLRLAQMPLDAVYAAYKDKDHQALAKALIRIRGEIYYPWGRYLQLKLLLTNKENFNGRGVREFINSEQGSILAERLGKAWVVWLSEQQRWQEALKTYANLHDPDDDARCAALQAAYMTQKLDRGELYHLWQKGTDSEVCMLVFADLAQKLNPQLSQQRLFNQFLARKISAAMATAKFLPGWQLNTSKWLRIYRNPKKYTRIIGQGDRISSILVLVRLAQKNNSLLAAKHLSKIESRLTRQQAAFAWNALAWQGAKQHLAQANDWVKRADLISPQYKLNEELLAWRVRSALLVKDWPAVQSSIQRMPQDMADSPTWIYWLARSFAAQGNKTLAQQLYQRISHINIYYGNLASNELGKKITIPPPIARVSWNEIRALLRLRPNLVRAMAMIKNLSLIHI